MTKNLTKGSVFSTLIFFSLPYLLSYFLQTLYGLADLLIAGQFNGAEIISAVAIGSQIMHMLTVIIVGLAMGATVLISRAVGAGDKNQISRLVGSTVLLFGSVAVIFTILLLIFVSPIISVMNVPQESIEETKNYLVICFSGVPFIIAYNIISSIFRGMGDSKTPMYFVAIACVVNILLDGLFMGFFRMGASGAAFATVLAQALSVFISLFSVRKMKSDISLSKKDVRFDSRLFREILHIGLPISLQDGFIQISFLVITIIANRRGVSVAAAVGIVEKIICFFFLIPSTMLSAVSALSAQNIGAHEFGRAKRTLFYGTAISVAFGAFFAILCQFISIPFISLFTADSEVIELGSQYLKTYSLDCIVAGVHFPFSGFFTSYGYSIVSFVHNVLSILLLRIPGAYFASVFYPETLYAMGLAAPFGSALSMLICIFVYVILQKKGRLGN